GDRKMIVHYPDLRIRPRQDLASATLYDGGALRRAEIQARARELLESHHTDRSANRQPAGQRLDQQIYFAGRPLHLTPGKPVSVGRLDVAFGSKDIVDNLVSIQHGTLGLDTEGRLVYTDHSAHGTFIKRPGSDKFETLKEGQTTHINPD